MTDEDNAAKAKAERKRKRLEAWRKRQKEKEEEEQRKNAPKKITLSLLSNNSSQQKKKKRKRRKPPLGGFQSSSTNEDNKNDKNNAALLDFKPLETSKSSTTTVASTVSTTESNTTTKTTVSGGSAPKKKRNRWDAAPKINNENDTIMNNNVNDGDALDSFMEKLESGAMGKVALIQQKQKDSNPLKIDVGGSMMKAVKLNQPSSSAPPTPLSGGVITAEDLNRLHSSKRQKSTNSDDNSSSAPLFTSSDWESDAHPTNAAESSASEIDTDDEDEEVARRKFIEALKNSSMAQQQPSEEDEESRKPQLASEVKSEKQRREDRMRQLEQEAEAARIASQSAPEIGRMYNDMEGGVMEEAERTLEVLTAAPDALEVLADLNKKKELKAVDHSTIDYLPIRKNLYIVPRSLKNLSSDDIADRRAKLKISVRGRSVPALVSTFRECGLSERILSILELKQKITTPFPVQAQCLPCIMAGRDVIGIAKTGSGKTLAYLLPMLRHIGDQSPLAPNESGPIGLVLAPARELAVQIHAVAKVFCKHLGFKSTAVYGGAGVAEQIADLKRGCHVVVATPGRMIDILTMQSGKILSLQRVSFVVMDEADRMFDMGFAPQISAILSAVRPDRQTVLFSATFPKAVEALARKSLKYPIEVLVGGRSVASDSVEQHAEMINEEDKFLRLLQLLGEHVDNQKKVIVFVDTQAKADSTFEQLIRCGYPSLSLHGGKEQEDRDSTISDFKRADGVGVLVATSVAGRGLDVPSCACVINYSPPNHLEDYVHRVGRTGRAGNKGVSFTFVNSIDESKYAPIVVRAMIDAGQSGNIPADLKQLSDDYKEKVKRGEARYAGSGFKGKGYTYDSSEMSDAQKLVRLEKRQALIEAGMIDPDEEDATLVIGGDLSTDPYNNESDSRTATDGNADNNTLAKVTEKQGQGTGYKKAAALQAGLSADILALPGMKEAIHRKAGIATPAMDELRGRMLSTGANHYVEEIEINDYPREARWKVTQKETTSRLQDEFQTAVTLKGQYCLPNTQPEDGERRLYLHLEATSERILSTCVQEIRRLLNEETLRVGARGIDGGSHRYSVI